MEMLMAGMGKYFKESNMALGSAVHGQMTVPTWQWWAELKEITLVEIYRRPLNFTFLS